jgi:hypothetical protein
VDGLDYRVRRRCQEAIDVVRAGDGLRLGATVAAKFGPDTREGEQRSVVVEGELARPRPAGGPPSLT